MTDLAIATEKLTRRFGALTAVTDGLRRRFDLRSRARRERHVRAGLRERGGRGQSDAPPTPGHQRTLAVEPERRCLC